jgi:uncharacterized surface protein with fasciclin (FAS1) repeats/LysM repeat protein
MSAVTAASLQNTLVATNGYTLFAPTNDAFKVVLTQVQTYLNEAASGSTTNIENLLKYHIYTTSRLTAPDSFTDATTLGMFSGDSANVKKIGTACYVDIAEIVNADQFSATNAQVNKVTAVMFPPSLRNVAEVVMAQTQNFYTFGTSLSAASLIATLSTSSLYTVLAPSDAAFNDPKVSVLINQITSTTDKSQLRKLLSYHVLLGSVATSTAFLAKSAQWPTQFTGDELTTLYTSNNVTVWQVSSTVSSAEQLGQGQLAVNLARNYGYCAAPSSGSGTPFPAAYTAGAAYFGAVLDTSSCTIGGASSFSVPLTGTNGVMHPIDRVLLPADMRSIYQVAAQQPYRFTIQTNLIEQALLTSTLNDYAANTKYTMFFVDDKTIEDASADTYDPTSSRFTDILNFFYCKTLPHVALATTTTGSDGRPVCWPTKDSGNAKLLDFVQYSIVKGTVFSNQLTNSSVVALNGQTLNICVGCGPDKRTYINDAYVVTADIFATNGVVHVISKLLQPSSTRDAKAFLAGNPRLYQTMETSMAACNLISQLSMTTGNSGDSTFPGIDKVTTFVPTNDAFTAAYPSGVPTTCAANSSLQYQLAYHVLPLAFSLSNLSSVSSVETLMAKISTHPLYGQGRRRLLQNNAYYNQSVHVNIWRPEGSTDLYIDNAKIDMTLGAVEVLNGYAYQIDKVLVPPSQRTVYQWADATPALFRELTGAIDIAGLAEVLGGTGPFTVFAPTNAAFKAIETAVNALVKQASEGNKTALQDVILNHVVYGTWSWPLKAGTMMRAVSGLEIAIREVEGKYYANAAEIASTERYNADGTTTRSIDGTNGLIYTVDSVLLTKLPIPQSAIPPAPLTRIPQGMCPEFAALLTPEKVPDMATNAAKGAAWATAKLDAKKTTMTVTVSLDSPFATSPGGTSFGDQLSAIGIVGPGVSGFKFDNINSTMKKTVYTRDFQINSALLAEMDEGKFYIEVVNTAGKGLRGTLTRQACYESYVWTSNGTQYHSEFGYAMAMVNPTMDEILFQFQTKIDFAAGKGREFTVVELMGQASSPNLKVNQPSTGQGALEYTFYSSTTKDLNYVRPAYAVTEAMAQSMGSSLQHWVNGFKIGTYYINFRTATSDGSTTSGYFYPAMPCPSLTAFALNRYLTYKQADSNLYVISQARLDAYERSVIISVKKINMAQSDVITGLEVRGPAPVGKDNDRVVLRLGGMPNSVNFIQKRFYLTAMDVFNFQSGQLYLVVKTSAVPEGEARGQYAMSTCFTNHAIGNDGNVVYGQLQVSPDGSTVDYPAFANQYATNFTTNATGKTYFAEQQSGRVTATFMNVPINSMNGNTALGTPQVLPGQPLPPVILQSPSISVTAGFTTEYKQDLPLMGVTLGLSQQAHDLLVLGQGSMSLTNLHASNVQSSISMKVVLDPSKYVVEAGDTLDSIAKAKGFTSWVPLQMVNRLTRPYGLAVGQVLELCYRHKVMQGESIYDIASKYGLTLDELLPMNPQLFDRAFIYEGQEVCVMPALKRIMCGYKGAYTIGQKDATVVKA